MNKEQTVLIVDDSEQVRDAIALALDADYSCDVAPSGEGALTLMAEKDFDLVITDLKMPGMPGSKLCRRIRESYPGTPVIIMSADPNPDSSTEALQAGALCFVDKPFSVRELTALVRQALSRAWHKRPKNKPVSSRRHRPNEAPHRPIR